ncbi:hypothetical protein OROGR_020514 [Orobanche gracilis]
MASECARNALLEKVMDNKLDEVKFKADLMKIAMTTLSSKILSQDKEHFAKLAVDAVLRLKGSKNLESIQIVKKPGGSLRDSFLDEGCAGQFQYYMLLSTRFHLYLSILFEELNCSLGDLIFTPLLHIRDNGEFKSIPYKPEKVDKLLEKAGYAQTHEYIWIPPTL